MPKLKRHLPLINSLLLLTLAACGSASATTPAASATPDAPTPAVELATQSPAPVEPIALVNGEAITSESYELSLALYLDAASQNGTFLATVGAEQVVLNDLIARSLLAQAAREQGFTATDEITDQRLADSTADAGGQAAFDEWLAANGFTAASFRSELAIEIEAAWMRDEIINAVPTHTEQVEARQILLSEEFQAERLLGQLLDGTPFETVVINNDPQRLGYLGWFPRGFLLQSEVETAAFALQPGEFSQIVSSDLGFHLIEVLDRDPNRELSPEARLELQRQALSAWLADQRQQSEVEVLLPQ